MLLRAIPPFSILMLCIFMLQSYLFFAQDNRFSFSHVGKEQGLINNRYNSFIKKDSRGFLWISSEQGVYRYDGQEAKYYVISENGTYEENVQSSFFEDRHGDLWFTTPDAIHQYNRKTDKIYNHKLEVNEVFDKGELHAFYFDQKNNGIWICSKGSMFLYNPYQKVSLSPFLPTNGRRFLIDTSSTGELSRIYAFPWSAGKGFEIWKKRGQKWRKRSFRDGVFAKAIISDGLLENDSTIWLVSNIGLIEFDLGKENLKKIYQIPREGNKRIWDIVFLKKHQMIISTLGEGLWEFDTKRNQFTKNWRADNKTENSLSSNSPLDLYVDNQEVLWINQIDFGLDYILPNNFSHINPFYDNPQRVKKLFEDENQRIWVLTENFGITIFDIDGKLIHSYNSIENNSDFSNASLSKDHQGNFWLINQQDIFFLSNELIPTFGQWKKVYHSKQSTRIYSLYHGFGNTLAITPEGVYEILLKENGTEFIHTKFFKSFNNYEFDILFKGNNTLTFAPFNSRDLWVLEKDRGIKVQKKINFRSDVNDAFPSNNKEFTWIASNRNGLFKYNKGNISSIITKVNLKNSGSIYSILEDNKRRLWLGTNIGLWSYQPESKKLNHFSLVDGLPFRSFSIGAKLNDSNGKIWMGGDTGLIIFDPEKVYTRGLNSTIYIERYLINNLPTFDSIAINEMNTLRLSYFENTITFDIRTIDYSNPDKVRIKFRLKNYDDEWVRIENSPIRFTKIPPGEYLFEAIPINHNNEEGEKKELKIIIPPPFWQTNAFYFIAILSIGLLIALGVSLYYRRKLTIQRRLLEKQKAINDERDRIAKELHDDMGGGLSSILYISEDLKFEEEQEGIYRQVDRISFLTKNALNNMKEIIWALDDQQNTINDLTIKLQNFTNEYLSDYPIRVNYNFEVPPNDQVILSSDQKRNLFLIVKESLHNIIKHSNANHIMFEFKKNKDTVMLSIQDDGKGFVNNDSLQLGHGLNNIKQRCESIGGKLKIKSISGEGTHILIEMKL